MQADIAKGGGAQNGIADRMGEDIGVGMALESEFGRDLHAAQHKFAVRNQPMNIISHSDSHHPFYLPWPFSGLRDFNGRLPRQRVQKRF